LSAQARLATRQIELLRPHEIRKALAEAAIVYVPLGTIEWHCEHLPVGLDALTAHGVCLRAAERGGGLVYPPLHYGTGGGHGAYPWTVMMPTETEIAGLLGRTLRRLNDFGVRLAVLFTGHFPPEQIGMVRTVASEWNALSAPMRALALAINEVQGAAIGPDHAGVFETTLLHALWPERVAIDQLPPKGAQASPDDPWSGARHDQNHPLWGIVGPDPRDFDTAKGPDLLEACVAWVTHSAREAYASEHAPYTEGAR
jgi:creatinine amidohydrolase